MSPRTASSRQAAGAVATFCVCCLALVAVLRPDVRPATVFGDFNAFYCAGAALGNGSDPYRAEPLGRCERSAQPAPLLRALPGLAVPAPLPPYALAPFVALARLSYPVAALVWAMVLFAAFLCTVLAMRRLTGLPTVALVAAFGLGDFYVGLCLGQVAPLCVALLAAGALMLARGRDELAAAACALATLEPHVGLPACLALFMWRPRTRVVLVGAAATAALLSVAVAGAASTVEYAATVVPAHALAEAVNEKQLSLTYLLARLGVAPRAAVAAGTLWYLAMLALAATAAGRLARTRLAPAFVVALPPAFAVLGGPFVHVAQVAAALPAALLLYASAGSTARRVLGWAVLTLAIPWIQFAALGPIVVPLGALAAALLAAEFVDDRPAVVAGAALAAMLVLGTLKLAARTPLPDPVPVLVAAYDPRALAEAGWATYVATVGTVDRSVFDLAKIPTLAALLATVVTAIGAAWPPRVREATTLSQGGNEEAALRRIALR